MFFYFGVDFSEILSRFIVNFASFDATTIQEAAEVSVQFQHV